MNLITVDISSFRNKLSDYLTLVNLGKAVVSVKNAKSGREIVRGLVGFIKNKTLVTIIFSFIIVKTSVSPAYAITAPCNPFYTKIDLIENERNCLSAREFQCSTSIDILNC